MRQPVGNSLRISIFNRDHYTCQYCGRRPPQVKLHLEHIISVVNGGSNHPSNLTTSCVECNMGKSRKSLIVEELQRKTAYPCCPLDFELSKDAGATVTADNGRAEDIEEFHYRELYLRDIIGGAFERVLLRELRTECIVEDTTPHYDEWTLDAQEEPCGDY